MYLFGIDWRRFCDMFLWFHSLKRNVQQAWEGKPIATWLEWQERISHELQA